MEKPLRMGLPLMLQYESEIKAFLQAKERIGTQLSAELGMPLETYAFLVFLNRSSLKEENRLKQLQNQKIYRLPIIHAETPIQHKESVGIPTVEAIKIGSRLETTIEQVGRLKSYDSSGVITTVDTHTGIIVTPDTDVPLPHPGIYSVSDFVASKGRILEQTIQRWIDIEQKAKLEGVDMVLENALSAAFSGDLSQHVGDPQKTPRLFYLPFCNLPDHLWIAGGKKKTTFDCAHWAAARHLPQQFMDNQVNPASLFAMEGISDWDKYYEINPDYSAYLKAASVLHFSNCNGIGFTALEKYPDLARKWSPSRGNANEGLIARADLRAMIEYAHQNDMPVIIEVNYDIKNIPENKFVEADNFLRYVFG